MSKRCSRGRLNRWVIMQGKLTSKAYSSIIQTTPGGVKNPNTQKGMMASQCVNSPRTDSIKNRFKYSGEKFLRFLYLNPLFSIPLRRQAAIASIFSP